MFGCQPNIISPDKDLKAVLEFLGTESSKLTNCGIYYTRQMYFKTGKIPSRSDLHKVLGTENRNLHYKAFYSDTAQPILTTVAESFKQFVGLLKGIKEGAVTQRPRQPNYRQGGMALVTYTVPSVKQKNGLLKGTLGSQLKAWFGLDAFYLPKPSNLDQKPIREYPILPVNRQFYV